MKIHNVVRPLNLLVVLYTGDMTRSLDLPTLDEFIEMVTAYKSIPCHGVGGPLHIVLDDMNVEAHHIIWCIEEWLPAHPCDCSSWDSRPEAKHDCTAETKAIADVLLALPDDDTRTEWIEAWWTSPAFRFV